MAHLNQKSPDLKIEYLEPSCLISNAKSARRHPAKQMRKLRRSISEFGIPAPIVIGEQFQIIDGHARVQAAIDLGLQTVPTICIAHLSPVQQKTLMLALNRIPEDASWDDLLLKEALSELEFDLADEGLELTGFDTIELDLALTLDNTDEVQPEAVHLPPKDHQPCTKAGQLWQCGPHRLLCGDAKNEADLAQLMDGAKADMVFTDPPYNVPIANHVRQNGSGHREFVEASGEMSSDEFHDFLDQFIKVSVVHSRPGALHYICMDWRHSPALHQVANPHYDAFLNICVWKKNNGGMGSFYRSQHEFVHIYRVAGDKHLNRVELGRHGRYRTNIWEYAGVNSFGANRSADLKDHPTIKPTDMVFDAILDCTDRNDHVLDPFMGSGTTMLAATRAGRIAYGVEKDLFYVDLALRRWSAMTGETPVCSTTGMHWIDPLLEDAND